MTKYPRNTWRAQIEVRLLGAIGEFYIRTFTLRAETKEQATLWFLDDVRDAGYEPRNILEMEKLG